jgi:hypothetical protein
LEDTVEAEDCDGTIADPVGFASSVAWNFAFCFVSAA